MGAAASASPTEPTDVAAELDTIISSNDLVLFVAGVGPFGLLTCPYCSKAEVLLKDKGITYTKYDCGTKGTPMRTAVIERCQGTTSVPEVFMFGSWVGGWDMSDGGTKGAPGIEPLMASGQFEQALAKRDASLCLKK